MAADTFIAFAAVHDDVEIALSDYDAVKKLHTDAGPVVVAVSDMQAKVEAALARADKLQEKAIEADMDDLEATAKEAEDG